MVSLVMSIQSYFSSSSTQAKSSTSAISVEDSSSSSEDIVQFAPPPTKKKCTDKRKKRHCVSKRKYSQSWEKVFGWLMYDEDSEGVLCRFCKESGRPLHRTGGVWVTKPFKNWKKAVEKMTAHERSDSHVQASEAVLLAAKASKEGTIVQQLQSIGLEHRRGPKIGLHSNILYAALIFSLVNISLILLTLHNWLIWLYRVAPMTWRFSLKMPPKMLCTHLVQQWSNSLRH